MSSMFGQSGKVFSRPEILSTFLQEALREGFTFRVLARHRSESSFIGNHSCKWLGRMPYVSDR